MKHFKFTLIFIIGVLSLVACGGQKTGSKADFSLAANGLSVEQGNFGTTTVNLNKTAGFNSSVALSIQGTLPTGVTAVFTPANVAASAGTSQLKFTVAANAPTGNKNITIKAVGGGKTHSIVIVLKLTASTTTSDFNVFTLSPSLSVEQGNFGIATVQLFKTGSFNSSIALSIQGALPTGVTAVFTPANVDASASSSQLKFTVASNAPTGDKNITIKAVGGGKTHSTVIVLKVIPPAATPDFSLAANNLSVEQGKLGTTTVNLNKVGGFNSAIALSIQGALPTGVTAVFTPANVDASASSSQLKFTVASNAPTGNKNITIKAVGAGKTHSIVIVLKVTAMPDFSLAANNLSVEQGNFGATTVNLNKVGGFNSAIALSIQGTLPNGVTAAFTPANVAASASTSQLKFTVASNAPTGNKNITIKAVGGGKTHSIVIVLKVTAPATAPDFDLTANVLLVEQGDFGTTTVNINKFGGFNSPIALSIQGTLPTGVTAAFSPANVAASASSSQLKLTIASNATLGNHNITIKAVGGGITHSKNFLFVVTKATKANVVAYTYANNSTSFQYTPPAAFSYNNGGGFVKAGRDSVGKYYALFEGQDLRFANVQITSVDTTRYCAYDSTIYSLGISQINVNCYQRGTDVLANSRFNIAVVQKGASSDAGVVAYATDNQPTNPDYDLTYRHFSTNLTAPIHKTKVNASGGNYIEFNFPGLDLTGANIQVTTDGPKQICYPTSWANHKLLIKCRFIDDSTQLSALGKKINITVIKKQPGAIIANGYKFAHITSYLRTNGNAQANTTYSPNPTQSFNVYGPISILGKHLNASAIVTTQQIFLDLYSQVQVTSIGSSQCAAIMNYVNSGGTGILCRNASGPTFNSAMVLFIEAPF